jgi:hypothetical protein
MVKIEESKPPHEETSNNGEDEHHASPRDSKGWDGKLRIERRPVLTNPEAISDPEYSDEENVIPGEVIGADEGMLNVITNVFSGHGGVANQFPQSRSFGRLPLRYGRH